VKALLLANKNIKAALDWGEKIRKVADIVCCAKRDAEGDQLKRVIGEEGKRSRREQRKVSL